MRTLVVSVETLGIDRDVWCDRCLHHSAATVHFTTTTGNQTTLRSKTVCGECK